MKYLLPIFCLLCLSAPAQDLFEKDKNRTVAVVMGRAISSGEVEKRMEGMREQVMQQAPNITEANLFWLARREVAHRAVLVETAKLYIEDLRDEEVVMYWTTVAELPDQQVMENLKQFREDYLLRQYLDGRMGLANRLRGVSPDMADFIRVTPQEMKDAYQHYQTEPLAEPRIEVAQFLFPDSKFEGSDAMREKIFSDCMEKLKGHDLDREKLEALAAEWPGCLFVVSPHDSLQPMTAEFARSAKEGEVSKPIKLATGVVVAFILKRVEETKVDFEQFQERYMRELRYRKVDWVTRYILDELVQQADYFPSDLFRPPESQQPPEGK